MLKYIIGGFLLCVTILMSFRWYFGTEKLFEDEVRKELEAVTKSEKEIITYEDLESLPIQLQIYLKKAEVIGKPRVSFFKVTMSGEMRMDKEKKFAPVQAEQYTFLKSGTRLFLMTMKFKGLSISGIHHYHSEDALMRIKILDMLKVVDNSGKNMHRAETVTYFNDLCIMAPSGLIEENIKWEVIDERNVKGTLNKHGHEVSAVLTFNEDGMLENFVSEDRMAIDSEGNSINIPWSTPMSSFGKVGSFYLPKVGEAVWHYPDEDFVYIRLIIEDVSVNQQ